MALYQLGDAVPTIDDDAYVAPEATVIGRVVLKARSSVWPGAVIRGTTSRSSWAKPATCRKAPCCIPTRAARSTSATA